MFTSGLDELSDEGMEDEYNQYEQSVDDQEYDDEDNDDDDDNEDDDDDEDFDFGEQEEEDVMEDEEQEDEMSLRQIAQVLHDAEKLYERIKNEEHLEPWMQSKLTKISDYMNAISENLEHDMGNVPGDDGDYDDNDSEFDEDEDYPDRVQKSLKSTVKKLNTVVKSIATAHQMNGDSIEGLVFKSLHAARQWNRFENPDKNRYYIDIMREKDVRKGFSKSTGLNAKYTVRDKLLDPETTTRGSYGNKLKKR